MWDYITQCYNCQEDYKWFAEKRLGARGSGTAAEKQRKGLYAEGHRDTEVPEKRQGSFDGRARRRRGPGLELSHNAGGEVL